MIRLLSTRDPDFARQFAVIRHRGSGATPRVEAQAHRIVEAVRRRGDRALIEFTRRYDGVTLSPARLRVRDAEIRAAARAIPPDALRALRLAARRIAAFHRHQRLRSWNYRDAAGLRLGQQITPLQRVGVYVPGGHAAYPSTVLMNTI